jgi:hypothetical protein
MRLVLNAHGGTVEKYIGDAIMAVFGLPTVHEDDALRAVRAAGEMQSALTGLNDELERRWGVRLAHRTGVNTGEVVAGDVTEGQRLTTGDAVNVAARLEQAASPLEVLIGESTLRLVRDVVDVEPVGSLELKGKPEPMPAYRLVAVREQATRPEPAGRPLVGRDPELALLAAELDEAISGGTCRMVTILGNAGLGKSSRRMSSPMPPQTVHEPSAAGAFSTGAASPSGRSSRRSARPPRSARTTRPTSPGPASPPACREPTTRWSASPRRSGFPTASSRSRSSSGACASSSRRSRGSGR